MATYKAIKGFKVKSLSSNPSPAITGQVWYNTTTGTLIYYNGSAVRTVTTS